MMELTPTSRDVVSKPFFGLRGFAHLVNPLIQSWYWEFEDLKRKSNIVATDFFLENNLIELAFMYNSLGEHCNKTSNESISQNI